MCWRSPSPRPRRPSSLASDAPRASDVERRILDVEGMLLSKETDRPKDIRIGCGWSACAMRSKASGQRRLESLALHRQRPVGPPRSQRTDDAEIGGA